MSEENEGKWERRGWKATVIMKGTNRQSLDDAWEEWHSQLQEQFNEITEGHPNVTIRVSSDVELVQNNVTDEVREIV